MSSSNGTMYLPLPGGEAAAAGASGCCSTTTLFGALAASFALSFFLITIFICLRALRVGRRRRDRAMIFMDEQEQEQRRPTPLRFGLDAVAIARLPSFPYVRAHDSEVSNSAASVECAICLSGVHEGEMVRQLPACGHMFHQVCIDMWLSSHASCPVCRGKAAPADELADAIAARIAVTPDDVVAPRVSMSVVVPIEVLEDEMVRVSSAATERVDARASRQGTNLESK
uniref:RING-type E3 ubiquitin transferase n=1 Tax=Oryza punctata TaxID=4537 RepID=A0A0E0JFI4_ORYPU